MNEHLFLEKNDKNSSIKYIDDFSLQNLKIYNGMNFLIGKNNSGKTALLNAISNGKIIAKNIYDNKKANIYYFKAESNSIEDENIKNKQIGDDTLINFFKNSREKDVTHLLMRENDSEIIKEFLENKSLISNEKNTNQLITRIDGIDGVDSGSGERRLLYLIYAAELIVNKINDAYNYVMDSFDVLIDIAKKIDNDNWSEIKNFYNVIKHKNNMNARGSFGRTYSISFEKILNHIEKLFSINLEEAARLTLAHFYKNSYLIPRMSSEDRIKLDSIIANNNIDYSYFNNRRLIINDYIKGFEGMEEEINFNYLFLIDEPEKFIHSSKFYLLSEIFNKVLSINDYGINIKILCSTHDERIIKIHNDYVENINLTIKEEGVIKVKNIFDNNINDFISKLKYDFVNNFPSEKYGDLFENKDGPSIEEDISKINSDYLKWFLTCKDNIKIFFSDDSILVEGYSDKLFLDLIYKKKQIIESDGTNIGMLIWVKLISENIKFLGKISILIDLDFSSDNKKHRQHTYMLRKYIREIFKGEADKFTLNSSLFNDIYQWAEINTINRTYANEAKKNYDLYRKLPGINSNDNLFEYHNRQIELLKKYIEDSKRIKNFKSKNYANDFHKYNFSKGYSEFKNYLFTDKKELLMNNATIYSSFEEYEYDQVSIERFNEFVRINKGNIEFLEYHYEIGDKWVTYINDELKFNEKTIISGRFSREGKMAVLDFINNRYIELSKGESDDFLIVNTDYDKVEFDYEFNVEILERWSNIKILSNSKIRNMFKIVNLDNGMCKIVYFGNNFRISNITDLISGNESPFSLNNDKYKTKIICSKTYTSVYFDTIEKIKDLDYDEYKFLEFEVSELNEKVIIGPLKMDINALEEKYNSTIKFDKWVDFDYKKYFYKIKYKIVKDN